MADRPKVGPADPETRRKKLREVLEAEQKPKPKSLRDAVDAGVDEGTESEMLPSGEKRRAVAPKKAKKKIVRRFGTEGKTEEEMGL